MKHKVLFVHGFGVKRDSRGMFTEIADFLSATPTFKDSKMVLINLNEVEEFSNDILTNSFSKQAEILEAAYEREHEDSETEIDIIAHSQGCVVTAIAELPRLRKVIMLAPPTNNDVQKTISFFQERPETEINMEATSYIKRADGSTTTVPKEYWEDRKGMVYADEYKKLSNRNDITMVFANQDQLVDTQYIDEYRKLAKVVQIDGNHNFDAPNREGLLRTLHELL